MPVLIMIMYDFRVFELCHLCTTIFLPRPIDLLIKSLRFSIGWHKRHNAVQFLHATQIELDFINFPVPTLNVSSIQTFKKFLYCFSWYVFRIISSLFINTAAKSSIFQLQNTFQYIEAVIKDYNFRSTIYEIQDTEKVSVIFLFQALIIFYAFQKQYFLEGRFSFV